MTVEKCPFVCSDDMAAVAELLEAGVSRRLVSNTGDALSLSPWHSGIAGSHQCLPCFSIASGIWTPVCKLVEKGLTQ